MAVMGDPGSGKSTLVFIFTRNVLKKEQVGVLSSGVLDDGKGASRLKKPKSQNEFFRNPSSSISYHVYILIGIIKNFFNFIQIIGFDSQGKIINHSPLEEQTWAEIIDQSTKILQIIDLREKTISDGLCSLYPEYVLLTISALKGITKNVEDNFKLAMAIKVPLIIVITHIDLSGDETVENFIYDLRKMISKNSKHIPFVIKNEKDVVLLSRIIQKESSIPIFLVILLIIN